MLEAMTNEQKTASIFILMPPSQVTRIEDWMFAHRIRSRGEAIRQLIDLGLQASADAETDEEKPR